MNKNEKKVLLIGKNSYIGRSFVQYCSQHSTLQETDYDEYQLTIQSISGKHGQWKEMEFTGYDVVILMSGIVHVEAREELYDEVNHIMAVNIAKKAKNEGVKQFVFLSTIAVYGDKIKVENGSVVRNPLTPYAKSKQKAEEEITALADASFVVSIIQPPMVYGKDCPGNFGRLVQLIRKVHIFPCYRNERSAIHINNLCEFIRQIVIGEYGGCYVPQNAKYFCSFDVASTLSSCGIFILPVYGSSPFIRLISLLNGSIRKVFGDFKYPLELSQYENIEYQKIDVEESLKLSISR